MQTSFKPSSFRSALLVAVSFAAILTLVLASTTLAEPPANSLVFRATDKPFGKSYTQWSEEWWQWALALPVEGHPFSEPFTNDDCNSGQRAPVWFLGISVLEDPLVERSCNIPANMAVFIGLPNVECDSRTPDFPPDFGGQTASVQRKCAKFYADHIDVDTLFCELDGDPVTNDLRSFRFRSSQFTFVAPTPWIFGTKGGPGTAVSDGYYVMLKPLSKGNHTLRCGGAFHLSVAEGDPFDADFGFGNTYHLTVE
jgi:hypothetical protein